MDKFDKMHYYQSVDATSTAVEVEAFEDPCETPSSVQLGNRRTSPIDVAPATGHQAEVPQPFLDDNPWIHCLLRPGATHW